MSEPGSAAAQDARGRFERPELAPLWRTAHQRLAQGSVTRLTLNELSPAEQRAIADLLGLARLPGPDASVALSRLDAVLAPLGLDTRTVVEAIEGPIPDLPADRAARRLDRNDLWRWLAEHPVVVAQPALTAWAEAVRSSGPIDGSTATTRQVLARALAALAALPANGQTLPTFAQQVCGKPHDLDDGNRLSGLVLRALATIHGDPPPTDAHSRRRLWELAGVACDALSTAVLVAGLRPSGNDALAVSLRTWADAAQPTWVTLAQLRKAPPLTLAPERVRVVENPSVVAEAIAKFGVTCPPLVCGHGWPNTAVVQFLRRLEEAGCTLAYHGDLDGEGIRIAAHVMAKTSARPWRMSATDYLAQVSDNGPKVGRVTNAPWDINLGPALRERAVAVSEEQVVDLLLADLANDAAALNARSSSAETYEGRT